MGTCQLSGKPDEMLEVTMRWTNIPTRGGVILLSLHAKETRVSSDEWASRLDCSMVMGSNPVLAWIFFRSYFQVLVSVVLLAARISYFNLFTAVQIYEFHTSKIIMLYCIWASHHDNKHFSFFLLVSYMRVKLCVSHLGLLWFLFRNLHSNTLSILRPEVFRNLNRLRTL